MSWDMVTGDKPIAPSGTGGGQDEIKIETGKPKRIALILPNGSQPYSYFEHCLEVETFEGGQLVRTFRTIRCPKTTANPHAKCPLCDGQQVRRRVRHACNAWDYEINRVQKLNQGESVFKPIATSRKLGVDVLAADWIISRTGQDRNDTEYSATNAGVATFKLTPEIEAQLFDIESEYPPCSEEEMRNIVESAGGNWQMLIIPPALQYPTLTDALAHKMPNGKYKDQTMQAIWEADKSSRGFISFLATKSDRVSPEKAAAQVIYVRLGGANIPGVPLEDGAQQTGTDLPLSENTTAKPANTPATGGTTAPPVNADRQAKIAEINGLFTSQERFTKAGVGFGVIVELLKQVGGGKTNIQDFNDSELDALLAECKK